MKITLTGSIGHIGKPLTRLLIARGHQVTVITNNAERTKDIEALSAIAAVGSVNDVDSLTRAFEGADAVYTMIPPAAGGFSSGFDGLDLDPIERCKLIADNLAVAIERTKVKRVIHLSSIGAHLNEGNGPIRLHYIAEQRLLQLTAAITFIRPGGFYYTLLNHIPMIRHKGFIAANYGDNDIALLVAPEDIAEAIADEFEKPSEHRKVRYVTSEELTCSEVAAALGNVIGKPDLQWQTITAEQMLAGAVGSGMQPDIAKGYVEMFSSIHNGILQADYLRNRPTLGKTKLASFLEEFAAEYNQAK